MFGDLMGNMQEKQEALQKKLKTIQVQHTADGFIIDCNAAKEVLNIEVPSEMMNESRKEELQDMLIVHINRALELAEEAQQKESESMLNDLLPGGLGSMFG